MPSCHIFILVSGIREHPGEKTVVNRRAPHSSKVTCRSKKGKDLHLYLVFSGTQPGLK